MSSPFQSLKKHKANKVPLFPGHMSGNRPIPFRHPEYSEDESRLLEEITTNMVQERRKHDLSLTARLPLMEESPNPSLWKAENSGTEEAEAACAAPSDSELMRMMMTKIAFLEQKTQTQENDLRMKDRQIKVLEDKLKIAEKARNRSGDMNAFQSLETHCLLLQQQVHEMETFLAEYGMVWVGEQNDNSDVYLNENVDDDDSENNNMETSERSTSPDNSIASSNPFGIWRQDTSLPSPEVSFSIDFNQLIENIKDLNVLAGEGVAQIKKTSGGAKFEVPESVQLTIYANGILLFDGPFRPYTDPATRQCVQDLLDGYFPSELQSRYPDGVPFIVTDLRGTHFQKNPQTSAFTGEGQTLGGDIKPSRLIPTNFKDPMKETPYSHDRVGGGQDMAVTATTSKLPGKPMSTGQFLNKLPKSVIKDGKVIDIRESVGKTLTGTGDNKNVTSSRSVTVVKTNVTKEMTESFAAPEVTPERPKSYKGHGDVTTLRVVTENGDHTYIVKMKFKETIGDLRNYLDTQRRPTVPYDIVSTFPFKVHNNNTMTLEASGLTPNAVLHLKPHK